MKGSSKYLLLVCTVWLGCPLAGKAADEAATACSDLQPRSINQFDVDPMTAEEMTRGVKLGWNRRQVCQHLGEPLFAVNGTEWHYSFGSVYDRGELFFLIRFQGDAVRNTSRRFSVVIE